VRLVPRFTLGTFHLLDVDFMLAAKVRAAPIRTTWSRTRDLSNLVWNHSLQFRLIGRIGDYGVRKPAFARARLRRQNMASKRMIANYFARAGLLEPFGRTFMCL
jgi:hypothetical protein